MTKKQIKLKALEALYKLGCSELLESGCVSYFCDACGLSVDDSMSVELEIRNYLSDIRSKYERLSGKEFY